MRSRIQKLPARAAVFKVLSRVLVCSADALDVDDDARPKATPATPKDSGDVVRSDALPVCIVGMDGITWRSLTAISEGPLYSHAGVSFNARKLHELDQRTIAPHLPVHRLHINAWSGLHMSRRGALACLGKFACPSPLIDDTAQPRPWTICVGLVTQSRLLTYTFLWPFVHDSASGGDCVGDIRIRQLPRRASAPCALHSRTRGTVDVHQIVVSEGCVETKNLCRVHLSHAGRGNGCG